VTRAAVAGVATFTGLSIDRSGVGYTLAAASTGLTGATSAAFNITAAAPAKLGFLVQPATTGVNQTMALVAVQVLDAFGNLTNSTASITLTFGANPGGGVLGGTLTKVAASGVALFQQPVDQCRRQRLHPGRGFGRPDQRNVLAVQYRQARHDDHGHAPVARGDGRWAAVQRFGTGVLDLRDANRLRDGE